MTTRINILIGLDVDVAAYKAINRPHLWDDSDDVAAEVAEHVSEVLTVACQPGRLGVWTVGRINAAVEAALPIILAGGDAGRSAGYYVAGPSTVAAALRALGVDPSPGQVICLAEAVRIGDGDEVAAIASQLGLTWRPAGGAA